MPINYVYVPADVSPELQKKRRAGIVTAPAQGPAPTPLRSRGFSYFYTDVPDPLPKQRKIPPAAPPPIAFQVRMRRPFVEEEEEIEPVRIIRRLTPPKPQAASIYTAPNRTPAVFIYEEDDEVIRIIRRVIPASPPVTIHRLLWRRRRFHFK